MLRRLILLKLLRSRRTVPRSRDLRLIKRPLSSWEVEGCLPGGVRLLWLNWLLDSRRGVFTCLGVNLRNTPRIWFELSMVFARAEVKVTSDLFVLCQRYCAVGDKVIIIGIVVIKYSISE